MTHVLMQGSCHVLSKQIQYKVLTKMHIYVSGCKNILVKLIDFNVILADMYRHPKNNFQNFINAVNCNLERLKCSKVFLKEDSNIRFKSDSCTGCSSHLVADYFDMLTSNGYFPLINIPTRVTENSAAIIDYIVTNDHQHHIFSGVINSDLSDHYPTFCIVSNLVNNKVSKYKAIYQCNFTKFKSEEFCEANGGSAEYSYSR